MVQARAGSPFCGVLDALGPPRLTTTVSCALALWNQLRLGMSLNARNVGGRAWVLRVVRRQVVVSYERSFAIARASLSTRLAVAQSAVLGQTCACPMAITFGLRTFWLSCCGAG